MEGDSGEYILRGSVWWMESSPLKLTVSRAALKDTIGSDDEKDTQKAEQRQDRKQRQG